MAWTIADSSSSAASEWRAGWRVAVSSALGYGSGNAMVLITAGLFIRPMQTDLGWSTTAVTLAPIMSLVWAFASPLSGAAIARWGPRRSAITGLALLGFALLGLAIAPASPASLYGLAAAIGFISILTNVPTYASGLSCWFDRHAGAAFGLAFNGSSLVALLAIPLVSFAISAHGWRGGYLALAAIVLAIGLPAVLAWFRDNPAANARPPLALNGFRRAVRDPRCAALALTFFVGSVPLGGFMGHLQPMLADRGISIVTATLLGMLYSVAVCAGRIGGGLLLDRFWPFAVAAILFLLAAIGGAALAHAEPTAPLPLLVLTVALVGMGQGAEADFLAFFALRCFDRDLYPVILGINVTASCLGIAGGGFAFAALFDRFGRYEMPFLLGAGSFATAALLLILVGLADQSRIRRTRNDAL